MWRSPDAGAKRRRSRWGESSGIAEGFGLLNVTMRLLTNKVTRLVEADPLHFDVETFLLGVRVLHSHG